MNPYAKAVLGPQPDVEGVFDFVGKAIKTVSNAIPSPVKAAVNLMAPTPKFLVDTAAGVASGERIDRAISNAAKGQLDALAAALPLAQIGLSFIPGIGQGVNAALGAAIALSEGKPISDAFLASVRNALPGGPLVKTALDIGMRGAVSLAAGKRLDAIALDSVRTALPGGESAKKVFDLGLALAQAKSIQGAGLAAAERFLPNHPLARQAFDATKRALASRAAGSNIRVNPVARPTVRPSPPKRPSLLAARRAIVPMQPIAATVAPVDEPPPPEPAPSRALPLALGAVALAAAGGGAWWWWRRSARR